MEKDQQLLNSLDEKSGVYFISPEHPKNKSQKFLVKIGLASSIRDRLESYLLCYPRGFNVFIIFQTKSNLTKTLEKEIHEYLTKKGRKADFPHTKAEEWYLVNIKNLEKIYEIFVSKSIKAHRFLPKPFKIKRNTRQVRIRVKPIGTPQKKEIEKRIMSTPPSTLKKKRFDFSNF